MKRLRERIENSGLLKIASLNSVLVLVKVISGLVTSNAIAHFVGSEGLALIGNLRNFVSSIQSFSTVGLTNGVVKYVAEFKSKKEALSKSVSTAYCISFIVTLIITFYCFFNANTVSTIVLPGSNDYGYVIKLLAIGLLFYASNVFLISFLNGLSRFKQVLIINMIGHILGLIFTLILIWQKGVEGALIAVVVVPAALFFLTILWKANVLSFLRLLKLKNFSFQHLKNLSAFSIMALFSATLLPLISIYIRNYIMDSQGIANAGYWEAMTRISKYYLMFVSSLLTIYILPRFSQIDNDKDFRIEVFQFYKTIVPVFALGLFLIYFLRAFIVRIVFTKEFQPVEDLFLWQLIGDFIKVLSLVIAYQLLAKKMLLYYMITEIASMAILYFASVYFIDKYGVEGATIAHAVNYLLYYILILWVFRKQLFGRLEV